MIIWDITFVLILRIFFEASIFLIELNFKQSIDQLKNKENIEDILKLKINLYL